jgi:P-type E1-E2 ATPase
MTGDGTNDSPALAQADVAVATKQKSNAAMPKIDAITG